MKIKSYKVILKFTPTIETYSIHAAEIAIPTDQIADICGIARITLGTWAAIEGISYIQLMKLTDLDDLCAIAPNAFSYQWQVERAA
jgi:hypothetical protein